MSKDLYIAAQITFISVGESVIGDKYPTLTLFGKLLEGTPNRNLLIIR